MKPLFLKAFVDGEAVCRLDPPESIAPRQWVLGVAAVQVTTRSGRLCAVLRAHVTGWPEPKVVPLSANAVVEIALLDDRPLSFPPPIAPRPPLDSEARLALFLDGEPVAESRLDRASLSLSPPPRAFGHVYCRWLRDGNSEPGFDLTRFQSSVPGIMFQRLINRPLKVGSVVSYTVDLRVRGGSST